MSSGIGSIGNQNIIQQTVSQTNVSVPQGTGRLGTHEVSPAAENKSSDSSKVIDSLNKGDGSDPQGTKLEDRNISVPKTEAKRTGGFLPADSFENFLSTSVDFSLIQKDIRTELFSAEQTGKFDEWCEKARGEIHQAVADARKAAGLSAEEKGCWDALPRESLLALRDKIVDILCGLYKSVSDESRRLDAPLDGKGGVLRSDLAPFEKGNMVLQGKNASYMASVVNSLLRTDAGTKLLNDAKMNADHPDRFVFKPSGSILRQLGDCRKEMDAKPSVYTHEDCCYLDGMIAEFKEMRENGVSVTKDEIAAERKRLISEGLVQGSAEHPVFSDLEIALHLGQQKIAKFCHFYFNAEAQENQVPPLGQAEGDPRGVALLLGLSEQFNTTSDVNVAAGGFSVLQMSVEGTDAELGATHYLAMTGQKRDGGFEVIDSKDGYLKSSNQVQIDAQGEVKQEVIHFRIDEEIPQQQDSEVLHQDVQQEGKNLQQEVQQLVPEPPKENVAQNLEDAQKDVYAQKKIDVPKNNEKIDWTEADKELAKNGYNIYGNNLGAFIRQYGFPQQKKAPPEVKPYAPSAKIMDLAKEMEAKRTGGVPQVDVPQVEVPQVEVPQAQVANPPVGQVNQVGQVNVAQPEESVINPNVQPSMAYMGSVLNGIFGVTHGNRSGEDVLKQCLPTNLDHLGFYKFMPYKYDDDGRMDTRWDANPNPTKAEREKLGDLRKTTDNNPVIYVSTDDVQKFRTTAKERLDGGKMAVAKDQERILKHQVVLGAATKKADEADRTLNEYKTALKGKSKKDADWVNLNAFLARAQDDAKAASAELREAQTQMSMLREILATDQKTVKADTRRFEAVSNCSDLEIAMWLAAKKEHARLKMEGAINSAEFAEDLPDLGVSADPTNVAMLFGLTPVNVPGANLTFNRVSGVGVVDQDSRQVKVGNRVAEKLAANGHVALVKGEDGRWLTFLEVLEPGDNGKYGNVKSHAYGVFDPVNMAYEAFDLRQGYEIKLFASPWAKVL